MTCFCAILRLQRQVRLMILRLERKRREGRGGGNETTHGHETKGRMSGLKLKHLISIRWKAKASCSHKRKFLFHKRDGSFTKIRKSFLLPVRAVFRSPAEIHCLSFLRLLSATRQSPDEAECKKTHSPFTETHGFAPLLRSRFALIVCNRRFSKDQCLVVALFSHNRLPY